MVAPKRGRGAKNQPAAKAKAAEAVAESVEVTEAVPQENNGESTSVEMEEPPQEAQTTAEGSTGTAEAAESAQVTEKAEEPKEEKVEPGKLLIENLPSSLLFEYHEKLKELFSQYGEVQSVKRGPINVTELTTTPTLSAIVEFKNKDSLDKAMAEDGSVIEGCKISLAIQPNTVDTTILVGVPFEASTEYVRLLFNECGEIAQIQEFSKSKNKILRVTYQSKDSIEKALKLDRELRINGFLVTVTKYREDDELKPQIGANTSNKNKRQHQPQQNRSQNSNVVASNPAARTSNYRGRGGFTGAPTGGYRDSFGVGGRGRGGFGGRGGGGGGGGFARGGGYRGGRGSYMGGGYMARGVYGQL